MIPSSKNVFPVPPPTISDNKRSAPSDDLDHAIDDESLSDIDCVGMPITDNANQVRRKIHRVIDNKEIKVGEFCNKIGVSNNAYNRFMKQSGPTKGIQSDVFSKAWEYFKRREPKGIKLPTAQTANKKAKLDATAANVSGKGGKAVKQQDDVDISDIYLEGEDHDDVAVYDTYDEIRRKIT